MKRTWFAVFLTLAMVSGATPPKTAAQSPLERACPLTGYEPYGCYGPEPEYALRCDKKLLNAYCSEYDATYDAELYGIEATPPLRHYWDGYRDYLRGLYPYDYYDDTAELAELATNDQPELTASIQQSTVANVEEAVSPHAPELSPESHAPAESVADLEPESPLYDSCPYDPYVDPHEGLEYGHSSEAFPSDDAVAADEETPYQYPYNDLEDGDPNWDGATYGYDELSVKDDEEYGYDGEYGYDEYGYDEYGYDEYGYDEYGYEGEDGYWEETGEPSLGDVDPDVNAVADASETAESLEASEVEEDYGYDDYEYHDYEYWHNQDDAAVDAAPSQPASDVAEESVEDYAYDGYGYDEYDGYESDYDSQYGYEYEYGQDYQYEYDGRAEAWNSGVDDLYARQSDVDGEPQAAQDTWFDEDAWNTFESTYATESTESLDSDITVTPSDDETWGEGDFYESAEAPVEEPSASDTELAPDYESQFDGTGDLTDPMDGESYWEEYEASWFDHNDGDHEPDYQSDSPASPSNEADEEVADAGDYWEEYSDYTERPHRVDSDTDALDWQGEDGDWQAWEDADEAFTHNAPVDEAPQFIPADSPLPESFWPEEEYQPYDAKSDGTFPSNATVGKTVEYLLPYAKNVGSASMRWLARLTTPSERVRSHVTKAVETVQTSMNQLNDWMHPQYLPPLEAHPWND